MERNIHSTSELLPLEEVIFLTGGCTRFTRRVPCFFSVDLAGFLGVNPDMPAGFLAVRGVVTIETSAPQEVLDQLKEAVDAHCPMVDTIRNEHPMATTYKVKA